MLVILVILDCPILLSLFLTIFVTAIFLTQITQTTQINSLSKSIHLSVFYPPSKGASLIRFSLIRLLHAITRSHSCGGVAPTGCQSHRYKVIPTRSCYIEPSSTKSLMDFLACHLSLYCFRFMCLRYVFTLLCYFIPAFTQTYTNS